MQLGMVGLGRMGANMTRRLLRGGHQLVVSDLSPEAVKQLVGEGAVGSTSLDDFVAKLKPPRAVWVIPAVSLAASFPRILCAPPCKMMFPFIELAEPEAIDIFRALLPSNVREEPASICKSDPVAPEIIRVLPLAPACNFAAVLLLTIKTPIV